MGPESSVPVFLTRKKDYLNMILESAAIVFALAANAFLIINKSQCFDLVLVSLIALFLLLLYVLLQASIMLFEAAFYSDYVCLRFVFLFFFKKTVKYKYEDLKVVLTRPKYKVLTFYKKGILQIGISTSLNRSWQEEQIVRMVQLLDEHKVKVRNI